MPSFPLTLAARRPGFERRVCRVSAVQPVVAGRVASEHAPARFRLWRRTGRSTRTARPSTTDRQGCALVGWGSRDRGRLRIHARLHALEGNRRAVLQRLLHHAGRRHPCVRRPDRRRGRRVAEASRRTDVRIQRRRRAEAFPSARQGLGVGLQLADRAEYRSVSDLRRSERANTSSSSAIRTGGRTIASTTGIGSTRTRSASRWFATTTSSSNTFSEGIPIRSVW